MPIPEDDAAEVARSAGLNLTDALALSSLARDREHAVSLAAQFAAPSAPEPTEHELAEQILARNRS